MTTSLDKPVSRLSHVTKQGRRVVVTLLPGDVIEFREKGTRHRLLLHIEAAYSVAAKAAAEAIKRERAERRRKKD